MNSPGQSASRPRTRCMASGSVIHCIRYSPISQLARGRQDSCSMRLPPGPMTRRWNRRRMWRSALGWLEPQVRPSLGLPTGPKHRGSRVELASSTGQSCALAGYTIALGAAWFGGDLVYDQRVGVTHAAVDEPESFTAVANSQDIPDGSMKRVRHDDLDLLIVRQHGQLCALAHACAHLGGPLSEGTLKDGSVVCPWHGSEFALDDGHVINGPATQNQPCLDVRERAGRIEVKSRS
jgi:nitrite reductase/ring-hydroxylating ferredoxin subunit